MGEGRAGNQKPRPGPSWWAWGLARAGATGTAGGRCPVAPGGPPGGRHAARGGAGAGRAGRRGPPPAIPITVGSRPTSHAPCTGTGQSPVPPRCRTRTCPGAPQGASGGSWACGMRRGLAPPGRPAPAPFNGADTGADGLVLAGALGGGECGTRHARALGAQSGEREVSSSLRGSGWGGAGASRPRASPSSSPCPGARPDPGGATPSPCPGRTPPRRGAGGRWSRRPIRGVGRRPAAVAGGGRRGGRPGPPGPRRGAAPRVVTPVGPATPCSCWRAACPAPRRRGRRDRRSSRSGRGRRPRS